MATDYGTPQLSSTAKVTVMIIPRNLEMPVFSAELYSPQPLSEKTQPDTVVMQAHVFYTSTVMYSIQSGNDNDYFTMDTFSGVIKTKQALDVSHFPAILIIRATHSNQSLVYGEAKVNITVVDENDFPPVFPNSSVTVFVKENENASLQVLRLNATDEDIGQNGELRYAILSGDEDYFRIDALTGALHTKVSFDFESDPVQYQIVVYAEDNGIPEKKRGYCTVFISITDINDNPPVFDSVPLMTVRENTKAGIYIGRVRATDKDTGDNAFIAYNITEGGEDFSVDDYGNITVKRSPDYEDKIEIIITVTATNNKTVPFYETKTEVRISVLDENDNPPLFTKNNYTARVNLTSPAGTLVTSVAATDQDTGNNAVVEYYLLDHEPESKYFIIEDMLKGTIMTIRSLPHPGIYELSVEARDRGYPARNSSARVTVAVIDNSPFQPHFNQSEISVDVEENTGTEFLVYTFSVLDTPNAHVSYTIRSGNELDHFQLNPNTGALYTSVNLDFENFSKYFITVEAIGPLSHAVRDGKNIARLTILVKDVNEVPKFSQESYSASIFNIAPYKSPVVQVRAFDQDSGVNGLLEYSLTDSQSQEFDVDGSTGEIYVVSVEGKTGESAFKVQAKDQNGKGLAAVTTVKVTLVSSSSDDVVVISINQAVNNVEKKKYEVKKALEKALGWDVHIISINGISSKMRLAKSNEETFFTFLATDNDKIMPSEEVKSKLESSEDRIQADLEVVFGEDVVHTVKDQFEDFALSSDQTSVIVLSVLLALTISGFVAFLVVTLLRNRKLKKESDPYKDTLSFGISYPNVFQQTEHQENMKNTEEQM
uniref:Cadherin EGF LAG seven-pass G-type receptor 1-like n=1 Tax=Lepisosteus oculatus TaxID=7918 RepID=W5NGU7_LEPOC|nr:PREDICTED: cadherin EGF LAG seven-pass G-type receptor 1-like [Lepisosteus oculatus]